MTLAVLQMLGQTGSSIYIEAACFDRRFPFSTKCIRHSWSVATGDNLLSCAFLKTSSAKQEPMGGQLFVRARPRQDGSLLKESPSRPAWRAHHEGDSLGRPVF